jgi:hypothetical protein
VGPDWTFNYPLRFLDEIHGDGSRFMDGRKFGMGMRTSTTTKFERRITGRPSGNTPFKLSALRAIKRRWRRYVGNGIVDERDRNWIGGDIGICWVVAWLNVICR